jgi:alanine racemase
MQATCHVSLAAIGQNYQYFAKRVAPAQVIPVIKANAYGHGAMEVARYLSQRFDPKLYAVATLEEARDLCQVFPEMQVLIFSRVFPQELPQLPGNALLTVGSWEDAQALQESASSTVNVHLNLNTGMNRLGLTQQQVLDLLEEKNSHLNICGIYSHFSSSDTHSSEAYENQKSRFASFAEQVRKMGFKGMLHISNSAAALHEDPPRYDAMRLGIGLYGYDTTPGQVHQAFLQPAMTVKAPLIRVEGIEAGSSVSYAERWTAAAPTQIGTLRIGYADGYNRLLTNRGMVSYEGMEYPVVGTVTMDHIMIDLGQNDIKTGSQFIVMGGEAHAHQIQEIARQLNTIPYEICCAISGRVKRNYSP